MQENAEYCDGQEFKVVFVTNYNRLWLCKRCAYQFMQPLDSAETPQIPAYHPKPIPLYFTMNGEQRARLKALLDEDKL